MLEGRASRRVPRRPHVVDPARADRRLRRDHAVELPVHDGGLEVRPGARGGQRARPQAVREHADLHPLDGRADAEAPARGRRQRRARQGRRRRGARAPRGRRHGLDHRQRARGQGRRGRRRGHAQARAPGARRQGARSSCSTTPTSRPRPRGSPAPGTSTPARTAPPRRASSRARASTTTFVDALTEQAKGTVYGNPLDDNTYMGPVISQVQRERVQGFIERAPSHVAGHGRRAALRPTAAATSSSRPSSPGCSRTTR